jgi:hypothetical protein
MEWWAVPSAGGERAARLFGAAVANGWLEECDQGRDPARLEAIAATR